MDCAACTARIDHCHGTLVVHPDGGFADCTDEACHDDDRVRHALIVDCQTIDAACGCVLDDGALDRDAPGRRAEVALPQAS